MSKKRQALYTVIAYVDSLVALNLTIEDVAKDFQQHFGCECEWALHDKDEGKKMHYHFDSGFEANVPPIMEFLKYCESEKYVKKGAMVKGQSGVHDIKAFAVTPYTGNNGEQIRYNHVIEFPAGRRKYLTHTSKSSEKDGKYQYDDSIIHSTPDFDLDKYYSRYENRKKKAAERDEDQANDPFIEIFTMIDQMKIDNVAHLIAVCLGDPNKHWYIPYIKADLMKYNVLINGFAQQRKWERQQMIGDDGLGLVEKMRLYREARQLPEPELQPEPQPEPQPQPQPQLQPEPQPQPEPEPESQFEEITDDGFDDGFEEFDPNEVEAF